MLGGRWWLQQLGGRKQRGQLIGMTENLRVVAAVLARPPLSRTEAAERRSCGPDCIDGLMLTAHALAVVWRLVCETAGTFQDA